MGYRSKSLRYLVNQPLFALLKEGQPHTFMELCNIFESRVYEPGEMVFMAGTVAERLYLTVLWAVKKGGKNALFAAKKNAISL